MRLVDTHCHIHDHAFDGDRDAVLARARAAGVEVIVTLGTDRATSEQALALAEAHPDIVAAAGVHPHDAADATGADLDALEEIARHPRVALVGEIGLDFYRNLSPRECQLGVLRRQLETAARLGKPVAVHMREAHDAMLPVLEGWSRGMGGRLPDGRPLGIMHYFSEDAAAARRYAELGFLISVHTSVSHPKAARLREVVRDIGLTHLVLETDSPYGAPQRVRGKRNEPAFVADAAVAVAEIKGIAPGAAAEATSENALRVLGIAVMSGKGTA